MDEHRAVELARGQHGLITRAQAQALGASDAAIARRVRAGRWTRLRSGVYVVGASPLTWEQRVLAAVLAAGPGAVASHRTAARLWSLVDRSGRIELLVPEARRIRLEGITVHRSRHLPADDLTVRNAIACTSIERTLVDVAPHADARTIGRWVDLALRDEHSDIARIAGRANDLTCRGRTLPRSLMEALALRCDGYDPGRSALEGRVLEALVRAGVPLPERQWRFRRASGRDGFIDLAYPAAMVAIELDGWGEHGLRSAFDEDRVRGNELVLAGWRLLRFTWSMPDEDICAAIASAIEG